MFSFIYRFFNKVKSILKLGSYYIVNGDRTIMHYQNGLLHRNNDLPAIIHSDGSCKWAKNGELYRDNNLPSIELINGSKMWTTNGMITKIVEINGNTITYDQIECNATMSELIDEMTSLFDKIAKKI